MNNSLDLFRSKLGRLFEDYRFVVKYEDSDKGECDHIYLNKIVHGLLAKESSHNTKYIFATIQRDKAKIRLRFYKERLENYRGMIRLLEKYKLRSTFYNDKDSREAYCFDFDDRVEGKAVEERAITEVTLLIQNIRKVARVIKNKRNM